MPGHHSYILAYAWVFKGEKLVSHLPAEQQRFEEYFRWSKKGQKSPTAISEYLEKDEMGNYVEDSSQRHWWTWQMAIDQDRLAYEMAKE
ncbi:hypothetical protein BH10PSE16_BH10PSE16_01280 [soil metagenome]